MRTRKEIVDSMFDNAIDRTIMLKDVVEMVNLICKNIEKGIVNDPIIKSLLKK